MYTMSTEFLLVHITPPVGQEADADCDSIPTLFAASPTASTT
jgi:hypothetical protein